MREKRENKWKNILESASSLIKLRKLFQYYKRGGAFSTTIIFSVCPRGGRGGGVLYANYFQCMSPRGKGGGAFSATIIFSVCPRGGEGGAFSTTIISCVIHVPEGGTFSTTIIFSVIHVPEGGRSLRQYFSVYVPEGGRGGRSLQQ